MLVEEHYLSAAQTHPLFHLAMIWCQPILFKCITVNVMFLLITFKEVTGHVVL
jgi:hypothetical protein